MNHGGMPESIEELKQYAAEHNWPLEDMRVYIGEDFKEPRAFGIYQSGDTFITYKNKADGSRAVRYEGPSERQAVGELYLKIHEEIQKRKGTPLKVKTVIGNKVSYRTVFLKRWQKYALVSLFLLPFALVGLGIYLAFTYGGPERGYYEYNQQYYYYTHSNWYQYEPLADDWYPYEAEQELQNNYRNYAVEEGPWSPIENSSSYDPSWDQSKSDTWDSNDSWDSFDTDWDSDW